MRDDTHHVEVPLECIPPGCRVGSIVTITVDDVDYRGRITAVSGTKAALLLFERLALPAESGLTITLVQALPKKEKMELIIQKATELGVSEIRPCMSARSITLREREGRQGKAHRWSAIAAKAVEQSRRRVVPTVMPCVDLETALQGAGAAQLKILLHEKEATTRLSDLASTPIQSIALAAGPEGGFTEEEADLARALGYIPVRLGGRILRCETASIAAISIAQFVWGDL